MAIFHLHAQVISRSDGRCATAAAAYRAGEKIRDDRTGLVFDYRRKKAVSYRHIFAPPDSPPWANDRAKLWNAAELAEIRKDAQVAREVEVALPIELEPSQHIILLERFIHTQFIKKGMVADVVIHNKKGNPHAHILLTTRTISADGFGQKNRAWNSKEMLEQWREQWAKYCNTRLMVADKNSRIDHRTLEAQGLQRIPTVHVGPQSHAMQAKGIQSTKNKFNTQIKERNMSQEKISNGLAVIALGGDVTATTTEIIKAKKAKNLFISASDYDNNSQYREAMFSRTYVPILLELFKSNCSRIEKIETDIGWCYRINTHTGAVYDYGSQIKIANGTDEEVKVAVKLAKEKGWKGLHITGSENFKELVFLEAVLSGAFTPAQITGYIPTKVNLEVIRDCRPALTIPKDKIIQVYSSDQSGSGKGSGSAGQNHMPRLKI